MKTNILSLVFVGLIGSLWLFPNARAVSPPPDGAYPRFTTAEGEHALNSLSSGVANTAVGWFSLSLATTCSFNTAVGAGALDLNNGNENTAIGVGALLLNTTGGKNTANGAFALLHNNTGQDNTAVGDRALESNTADDNTAVGALALFSNTTGTNNTGNGFEALYSNTTGLHNTAIGDDALSANTTGDGNTATGDGALGGNTTAVANTADGFEALFLNTTGGGNTADGFGALFHNTTGNDNIALGNSAGENLTTGDYNIDIGNGGVAGDTHTIRLGDDSQQGATYVGGVYGRSVAGLEVVMDSSTRLGTLASSRRFKNDIRAIGKTSEAILAFKPVMFRYKKEIDPEGILQFGLVAEDVEKVNPDLVVRDKEGKPYSVRYNAVNAMLLNEFLKEHRTVQLQGRELQRQAATIAKQQNQIEALTAGLQEVSAQLETSKSTPQTVLSTD